MSAMFVQSAISQKKLRGTAVTKGARRLQEIDVSFAVRRLIDTYPYSRR